MHLVEDIRMLGMVYELLKSIAPENVTADREFGDTILNVTKLQVRACERYAKLKLRRDYLSP